MLPSRLLLLVVTSVVAVVGVVGRQKHHDYIIKFAIIKVVMACKFARANRYSRKELRKEEKKDKERNNRAKAKTENNKQRQQLVVSV